MTASKARRLRREQALSPKGQRPSLVRTEAPQGVVASRVETEPPQTALRHDAGGKMSRPSEGKQDANATERSRTVKRTGTSDKKPTPSLSSDNAAFPPAARAKDEAVDLGPLLLGALGTIITAHPAALAIGMLLTATGTDE